MASPQYRNAFPDQPRAHSPPSPSTRMNMETIDEKHVVPGRVFWLPPMEDLHSRAVRRAHGKGPIEEGIFNHPVVVISRPADEAHTIHFQIITSFQGKKLHEIYSRANEFHAGRRSWYLPISPSPDHPDAASNKTRKRFPTLHLAHGAVLRWDSYANIRHLYKIEWKYLKPYVNPDTPAQDTFRFDRESTARLLAKTKILTNYDRGPQYMSERPVRSKPKLELPPPSSPTDPDENDGTNGPEPRTPRSDAGSPSPMLSEFSESSSPLARSDFRRVSENDERCMIRPPKAPPDRRTFIRNALRWLLLWPVALMKLFLKLRRGSYGRGNSRKRN